MCVSGEGMRDKKAVKKFKFAYDRKVTNMPINCRHKTFYYLQE